MDRSDYITAILFLLLLGPRAANGVDTATVTITAAPDYEIQPVCVQSCVFDNTIEIAQYLVYELGCTNTIYDACYCTQIQDQIATSYLSSCVSSLCKGTAEISNAISLYESYCNGAGYPRAAAVQTSSTSASSAPASQSASVTLSQSASVTPSQSTSVTPATTSKTSTPTVTSSSPSSTSSSNPPVNSSSPTSTSKSKTAPIVGGVVGGLGGLGLVIGIIFFFRRKRHSSGQHQESAAQPSPQMEKPKRRPVGGRAELQDENKRPDSTQLWEIQGEGRHGLRPEELDDSGRYIGMLHGDGRHIPSAELA